MLLKLFPSGNKRNRLRLLFLIGLVNLAVSLWHISDRVPFFSDQVWFYTAAGNSLLHGNIILIGLKSSISWLHHGVFWMYILIPVLWLTDFYPLTGHLLTVFLNLFNIPLIYYLAGLLGGRKAALISVFIFSFSYYLILLSRFGYHISLIPLLFLISALSLIKKRYFISGLFLGFLYQVHLLAFIYWPVAFLYLLIKKEPFILFILGSAAGVVSFFIIGPIQTFGIIAWLAKFLISLKSFSGVSYSQSILLIMPLILVVSVILSRLNNRLLLILGMIYVFLNLNYLASSLYYPKSIFFSPDYSQHLSVSKQILGHSRTDDPLITVLGGIPGDKSYSDSYTYLIRWLEKTGLKPAGKYSKFIYDENTSKLIMLE